MTNDRLKELTQKVYDEGVQKAKEEAAQILNNAQIEAEEILKETREKANKIVESARNEALTTSNRTRQELDLALTQTMQVGKRKLAESITTQLVSQEISNIFEDKEFVKRLIEAMVQHWMETSQEADQVQIILPESWEAEMNEFFERKLRHALDQGMKVTLNKELKGEFIIRKLDEGYQLYFSDEQFEQLFKSFLRPKTRELLFSE